MTREQVSKFENELAKLWEKYNDDSSENQILTVILHHDKQAISFFGDACIVCLHAVIETGIKHGIMTHRGDAHLSDNEDNEENDGNDNKPQTH